MLEPTKRDRCEVVGRETPKREADVPAALNVLNERISELNERIDILASRLDPVLRSEPTSPVPEKCRAGGECTVGTMIRSEASRVDDLSDRLRRLTDLLEV